MMRLLSVCAAIAVGATALYATASAQSAAIAQRKEALKAMSAAGKEPSGMMKGETAFDLPKVQAALKVIQEQSAKLPNFFPDDSKTGDTNALPVIWEKKADVVARFNKLNKDATDAAASIRDEATFKSEWPKVVSNCGGCHKEYRKP